MVYADYATGRKAEDGIDDFCMAYAEKAPAKCLDHSDERWRRRVREMDATWDHCMQTVLGEANAQT
eukprot:9173244-Alexandrium_andersonii.AAC.1